MNENRVVVTGLGAVTPIGNSVEEFWRNAIAGKSGAAGITRFDTTQFKTKFACEIKDFDPSIHLERNEIRRTDLFTQYALYAASEAVQDAGIDLDSLSPFDFGVIWGSGQGGMATFEEEVKGYVKGGYKPRFSPFFATKLITNMAAGMISMKYGLMGINYATVSACATSSNAIINAYHYIKLGKAKAFITGGSEAPITEASIGGFNSMRALSTYEGEVQKASRPFDRSRDGFVMGEGGAALIIEDYEFAKKRGAHIYAEIVGASMTADAYHIAASHPEGKGAARAMQLALEEAQMVPSDLDYLNAHATSTPLGDLSEMKAVNTVFSKTSNLKISATKSMTGHLLGGAGAIESILSIKAINDGIIPATINTVDVDESIPEIFDIVLHKSRAQEITTAMNNTFGFGGHNAILLFRKM